MKVLRSAGLLREVADPHPATMESLIFWTPTDRSDCPCNAFRGSTHDPCQAGRGLVARKQGFHCDPQFVRKWRGQCWPILGSRTRSGRTLRSRMSRNRQKILAQACSSTELGHVQRQGRLLRRLMRAQWCNSPVLPPTPARHLHVHPRLGKRLFSVCAPVPTRSATYYTQHTTVEYPPRVSTRPPSLSLIVRAVTVGQGHCVRELL
jgi:hypothetical protein